MVYDEASLVKFAALLLTATAVTPAAEFLARGPVLAQSFGDNLDSFPIPSSLPEGSLLRVDGSSSMRVTNEVLESRFEAQYPNVDVEHDASRTDAAIAALLNGDIDLVASGRPLTNEEAGQGLVAVPLEREKLAILLGADNPFDGNLTFEQFAQIFRGEITNWSEVGGPDLAIRLIDRPDYSDTRRALSTYAVFQGQPFETGETADPVTEDETETVIAALENDGIGYAVFSQVEDAENVQILPMHGTLPDDPRYPYSQYRAFIYQEEAAPATLAFLGFATSEPGQEAITDVPVAEAETDADGAETDVETAPETDAVPEADDTETAEAPEAAIAETPEEDVEDIEEEAALVPDGTAGGDIEGGVPGWLWLLGIPVLGGLLWWLLKNFGADAPPAPPPAAVPETPPAVTPEAVPVAATTAAASSPEPRIVLTPRDHQDVYVYWEIPSDRLDAAQQEGGDRLKVRLYDVTDQAPDAALPPHTAEFDCVGTEPDRHLPIAVNNRDYRAEIGHVTADNRWLPLAISDAVRVPAQSTPSKGLGAAGATVVSAAAVGVGQRLSEDSQDAEPITPESTGSVEAAQGDRIILTPRNDKKAYVYWEVSDESKATLKAAGGQDPQLRIYDVTDIDFTKQPPHSVLTYEVAETDCDRFIPLPSIDRDFIAEIGYRTEEGGWRELARSLHMRPRPILEQSSPEDARAALTGLGTAQGFPEGVARGAAEGVEGTVDAVIQKLDGEEATPAGSVEDITAPPTVSGSTCSIQTVQVHNRRHAVQLDEGHMQSLQAAVSAKHSLENGLHILRIREGSFRYDGNLSHPGEPFVLLWIYGGRVINKKTGVPVSATWSTLNGYADTLTLDVLEPAQVCAFFVDTFPDDNVGEITLSVIRL
ncbi:DUF4912 domain-containing protein [Oscillatoria sp. CS-180]|uniref:DUF4912 domain-containing protein n=1 Tax=Oscillatoria sp. CS-180 TaxID=3021720 RepID=UPI00232AE726|nr:DUF4912 domain-containing protein [Oscillatoria sp. CS-180]MDB9524970.1 DUF4912 domain-containing protein [Oscillatoria sp. CS-180]